MPTTTAQNTPTGIELATYDTDHHGPRILIGARIDGDPHLFDVPAQGNDGTGYLVERRLTSKSELDALIADYLAKAERLGYPRCTDGSERHEPSDRC